MGKCEHGLTSRECYVCASPKHGEQRKPEALRLACELEACPTINYKDHAAELRRLHAENERLHQINQSHEMKLSVRGYELQIEGLMLAHAELRERNAELLEALKYHQEQTRPIERTRAAIAKAEGEQI